MELPVALQWEGPDGCPDATTIQITIARLVSGRRLAVAQPLVARVEARLTTEGRWSARMATRISGEDGERIYEAQSCAALADATALILALAIAPEIRPKEPEALRRWWLSLRPQVVADFRMLPQVGLGLGLAVAFGTGRLRFEASGYRGFSQRFLAGPRPESGVDLQIRLSGGARACWSPLAPSRVDLGVCLGAQVAEVHGEGFGMSVPQEGSGPWVGLLAGAGAGLRLSPVVSLRLDVDAGWSVVRPAFAVNGYGAVQEGFTVVARTLLGLELRLW